MKQHAPLLFMLRRPIRTGVFLILLGIASFLFMARAVEGLVVNTELDRLGKTYRSVGTFKPIASRLTQDNVWVPDEVISLIENNPAVQYYDGKRLISATMDGVYSPDIDTHTWFTSYTYVYATLVGKNEGNWLNSEGAVDHQKCWFRFEVDTYLLGFPEYDRTGEILYYFIEGEPNELNELYESAVIGERYLVKGEYWVSGMPTMQQPPTNLPTSKGAILYLSPINEDGDYFLAATGNELETIPGLAEDFAILDTNIHTIFLRTTKNMDFLPDRQDSLLLVDGRFLTEEDSEQANPVCMIRREFADLRGLEVGDTLTVTMRNTPEQLNYWGGTTAARAISEMFRGYIYDSETPWESCETREETFTIVGIYSTTNVSDRYYTVSWNNVFVPDSCVPADWTRASFYADYYFLLKDASAQEEFYNNYFAEIGQYDYLLEFRDNSVDSFAAAARPIRQSIVIGLVSLSCLTVLIFVLSSFLYFHQSRKNFAIMRALGNPAFKSIRQTASPILIIGGLGILLGGIPAWFYAQEQAKTVLLSVEGARFTPPSYYWLLLLFLLLYVLLFVLTLLQSYGLARCSVLELLQGKRGAKRVKRRRHKEIALVTSEAGAHHLAFKLPPLTRRSGTAGVHIFRTLGRRMTRQWVKPVLVILIAAGTIGLLSWMQAAIEKNMLELDYLYENTQLEAVISLDHNESGSASSGGGPSDANQVPVAYIRSDIIRGDVMRDILLIEDFVTEYYTEAMTLSSVYGINETPLDVYTGGEDYVIYADGEHATTKDAYRVIMLKTSSSSMTTAHELQYLIRHPNEATEFVKIPYVMRAGYVQIIGIKDYDRFASEQKSAFNPQYFAGYGPEDLITENGEKAVLVSKSFLDNTMLLFDELATVNALEIMLRDSGKFLNDEAYRIIGVYESFQTSEEAYPSIIMSISDMLEGTMGTLRYTCGEFQLNPAKNRELDDIREAMNEYIDGLKLVPRLIFVINDYPLVSVVKPLERNLALMQLLYPIAMVATALISAALTILLILQAEKDAALLRVLGTTKRRVRIIFFCEQGLPCLAGLIIGAISALALFNHINLLGGALFLGACFAAAIICVYRIVWKKPLELLQVKE